MTRITNLILKLKVWKDTRGQDLIEYALMAGFVAVAAGGDPAADDPLRGAFAIGPAVQHQPGHGDHGLLVSPSHASADSAHGSERRITGNPFREP